MCFYYCMGHNIQISNTNYVEQYKNTLNSKTQGNNVFKKPVSSSIESVPNITPDYNVKVPIGYQKIKDLALPYDLKASWYKLANGQNVIIIPKEGTTVVKSYVKTGSMNEPDNLRGISHYIEHNLFNGSEGLEAGEFFERVDDMGASTNAATGFAETNYYISSNLLKKDDLEQKIKLHASMLQSPRFAVDMLEKEKGIVNSEINMILSDPQNIGFNRVIKSLYGINSTSTDLIGGSTQNITNLTRDDVVSYFDRNYYPANMVTVVSGEVDPDETMSLISKYFNSKKLPPASRNYEKLTPTQSPKREDLISDKAYSTGIYVGFNGPANNDAKGQVLIQALAKILTDSKNSRISNEARKYNTDVFMNVETVSNKPDDGLAIIFDSETTEENSAPVLRIIGSKIDELKYKLPTNEEMNWVKKSLKKEFASRFECSEDLNTLVGSCVLDGIFNSINDYEKIVDNLTPQDISDAARKYLDTQKAAIVLIHPDSVDEATIRKNHVSAQNITFTGNIEKNTSNNNNIKKALNINNVKQYKLSNNMVVVTNDVKTNNCKFLLSIDAPLPANVNPVTPIILGKMLNAGSAFRNESDYLKELDNDAISVGFSAGEKAISTSGSFCAEDLEKTLNAINEVLYNPRLFEATFEIAKSQLKDGLALAEKTPVEKLYKDLFPNDNYGATNDDLKEALKTVTLADVKGLYQYIMQNPSATLVISAPFSKRPEMFNILVNKMACTRPFDELKIKKFDNYEPIAQTKVLTDVHNKNQADIIEAFKFKNNGNLKDDVTVLLLNTILGGNSSSRLFNDLREQQKLAYSVRSRVNYYKNTGVLMLRIGTTTENKTTNEQSYDNVQKSIDGFNKHIQKIKSEKVSEKELENAKLYCKNMVLSANEDVAGKTSSLESGLYDYYGLNKENLILEMIDKITVDDIYNAANNIFNSKPVYSINATQNTLDANKDYFARLETV